MCWIYRLCRVGYVDVGLVLGREGEREGGREGGREGEKRGRERW